jgi:hypothetical protein
MHTVELLDQALETARRLGYGVRQEWLGGVGGGRCQFAGRNWIFVDLALNVVEQLDQVISALKADPGITSLSLSPGLRTLLDLPQRVRESAA